jgi:hypothetical protein
MLKRNDLVKQFEMLVKQEITNHNNSILASNKEINEIKNRIDSILVLIDDQKKVRENQLMEARMSLNKIEQELREQIRSIFRQFNDLVLDSKKQKDEFIKYIFDKTTDLVRYGEYHQFKTILNDKLKELSENNELTVSNLVQSEKRLNNSIKESLEELKETKRLIMVQMHQIEDDLKKEIDIYKVDNQGLIREIEILKKKQFIQEKMIENLYTLIKRIDANVIKTNTSHIKG